MLTTMLRLIPFSLFPEFVSQPPGYYNGAVPAGTVCGLLQNPGVCFCKPQASSCLRLARPWSSPNFYSYIEQVSAGVRNETPSDFSKFPIHRRCSRSKERIWTTLSWQNGCTDPDPAICPTIIQPGQNLKGGGDYIKVLPSASLRYALTNNTDFRPVYSRGLSRPNPQDIAQSFSISHTPRSMEVLGPSVFGNPNLKAENRE